LYLNQLSKGDNNMSRLFKIATAVAVAPALIFAGNAAATVQSSVEGGDI
jgi:hypothetical protein